MFGRRTWHCLDKGSGCKGANNCVEVSTRRGHPRQESRDEPSKAGPGA